LSVHLQLQCVALRFQGSGLCLQSQRAAHP
jgi:hypothetical protein